MWRSRQQTPATLAYSLSGTDTDTDTITVTITVTDVDETPGKPAAPTVTAGSSNSLSVTWSVPPNTGPAITDYDVQYRVGSSGSFTDAGYDGTDLSTTISGLSPNTSYQVQVWATNDEGTGEWSDSGSGPTSAAAPTNTAPTAADDSVTTDEDTAVDIDLVANDTDPDFGDTLAVTAVTAPSNGTAVIKTGSTTKVTYTPNPDFNGSDSFTYTVSDGGATATATVTVTVNPVNDPPVFPPATADFSVRENSTAIGVVAATDVDHATLSYTLGGDDGALFTINGQSRELAFATAPDLEDPADADRDNVYRLTVTATDGDNAAATIGLTVTVTDVAEPPDAPAEPDVTANASSGTNTLDVDWTAPANTGGPPITGYHVRYRISGSPDAWSSANVTVDVDDSSATITGLASNTEYEVQVRAVNDEGESGWSASNTGTTLALTVAFAAAE